MVWPSKERLRFKRAEKADLSNAAASWWYIRLGYYEMIVDFGYIQYPRDICWVSVYEDEFVPEMIKLGHSWREPTWKQRERLKEMQKNKTEGLDGDQRCNREDKNSSEEDASGDSSCSLDGDELQQGGSISTWYRGRSIALQRMAIDRLGPNAKPFKLVSRAKHSAYVSGLPMDSNHCLNVQLCFSSSSLRLACSAERM